MLRKVPRLASWNKSTDPDQVRLREYLEDTAELRLASSHVLRLETRPGRYAVDGSVVALTHPAPADREALQEAVNDAVAVGATRTMQQDASYGLRQLADVALKALSPGVNDPTTAQDATFHTAAVCGPFGAIDGNGDALIVAGVEVIDILSPTSTRRAVLDENARVDGWAITYPPVRAAD